jgi:beta-galactosidase GanA
MVARSDQAIQANVQHEVLIPVMSTATPIPHLRKTKTSSQLIVKGKPFLMLAGELHNSSLSDPAYMSTVWPNMKAMHVNTLLGSVTWEMIEPIEGSFRFDALDQVIADARTHGMHLVLLWFGSFKNALSTYAPAWVKQNPARFPRVHTLEAGGVMRTLELVSPFNERAWQADARAFAALMRHLREFDGEHSTVIMVQVENETGLLGDSRDRSRIANELFKKPMPKEIISHLQSKDVQSTFKKRFPHFETAKAGNATWEDAFGEGIDAEEMFMADAFSRYVGIVAAAGKAEYPIPHYTNVWLNFDDPSVLDLQGVPLGEGTPTVAGGGAKAGVYPSGGPVPHTIDLWKLNTPALDFIAPDLYLHDYEWVCHQYRHEEQPLFIPEQKRDAKGARRVMLAYGTYLALGCSPFGIDSVLAQESPITRTYRLLSSVSKHILEAQAERPEEIMGFFFDETSETKRESNWVRRFGDFELTIDRAFVFGKPGAGEGIVIHQGNGKFLLIGWGFQVTFKSTKPSSTFTGILYSEEKTVDATGNLHSARVMNGDETRSGAFYIMPNEDPDYGGFPIAVTIPARTCIAECTAYTIEEMKEQL